jgi:hypothetical protein
MPDIYQKREQVITGFTWHVSPLAWGGDLESVIALFVASGVWYILKIDILQK